MASGTEAVRWGESLRRRHPSSEASAYGPMRGRGWIPIALGSVAIVAGLGSRRKGSMPLALTAFAGVAAVAAVRGLTLGRGKAADSKRQGGASGGKPEVERSITIGKTADELRDCLLDPDASADYGTLRNLARVRRWPLALGGRGATRPRPRRGLRDCRRPTASGHRMALGPQTMGRSASVPPRPAAAPWSPCSFDSILPVTRSTTRP